MHKYIKLSLLVISISTIAFADGDWNDDGFLDILDIVGIVDCILSDCWEIHGCTDLEAINYNPEATIDDGSCLYSCIDIDGNEYGIAVFGNQVWMTENLKVTHYSTGEEILTDLSNWAWSQEAEIYEQGAFAVYPWYEDMTAIETCDQDCAEVYGYLYNWYAVTDEDGLCPEGWHIPSDDELLELEMFIGMSYEDANDTGWRGTDEGAQLSGNSDLWADGNLENDDNFDSSGFIALPAGYRTQNGEYRYLGETGRFWSNTQAGSLYGWGRSIHSSMSLVERDNKYKKRGYSVRCISN